MRFIENKFTPSYYNTIGVDYVFIFVLLTQKLKVFDIDGYRTKMVIVIFLLLQDQWDTAGQDRFKNITSSYYRGADGIVVMYDITDGVSFQGVQGWLNEI